MIYHCASCPVKKSECKALVSAGKGKVTRQEIERREMVCLEERLSHEDNYK